MTPFASDSIETAIVDSSLIIRFTRPELRNPLSVAVLVRLDSVLNDVDSDGAIKRLIFTGEGEAFASGADLREIADVMASDAKSFARRGQDLMAKIAAFPQTTVAAINGFCFGGALDLVLSCDRRIASPNAQFAHPGAGLGIITGWGGTQRLPRLIGTTNALEMFYTATAIDAERALQFGLIDEIADDALEMAIGYSVN